MARGGRNTEVEKDRMNSMEQFKYTGGRSGSGPSNFQKPAYDKPARGSRNPKSAPKPSN